MAPFREEQILVIAPGCVHTLVQYGCGEGQTNQHLVFQSRMFFQDSSNSWSYYDSGEPGQNQNVNNLLGGGGLPCGCGKSGELARRSPVPAMVECWFQKSGRLANTLAFQAFLYLLPHSLQTALTSCSLYIYSVIKPTLHTPLLIVTPPMWTLADKERLTRFSFEKLQVPALSIISDDVANCIAFATPKAIVAHVGYSVTMITVVADFLQEHSSVSRASIGTDLLEDSPLQDEWRLKTFKERVPQLDDATNSISSVSKTVCAKHFQERYTEISNIRKFGSSPLTHPCFPPLVDEISNAITNTLYRSEKIGKIDAPIPLIICGAGATLPGLQEKIHERLCHILDNNILIFPRHQGPEVELSRFEQKGITTQLVNLAKLPSYLPEWVMKENGREFFIGAILFAKLTFGSDASPKKHISRQDYNEVGPIIASSLDL